MKLIPKYAVLNYGGKKNLFYAHNTSYFDKNYSFNQLEVIKIILWLLAILVAV